MPVISIEMNQAEKATKEKLIQKLTQTASEITKIPETSFTVLINELDDVNIGIGGNTLKEIIASHS